MKRIIPSTMVSQHPDHANIPYWHDREFIRTNYEPREVFFDFSELGVDEYKWDWEGKLVDESVMERLLSERHDYFQENPIGHKKFITFRLPNPKVDTEFRLGRAFMTLLSSSVLAHHFKLPPEPLFEVIVPMTETAEELIDIQEAFAEMAGLKHRLYRFNDQTLKHIQIIPLFEDVSTIIHSDEIIASYVNQHRQVFGSPPEYIRPYIARSDPALNSGMVATVLATKIALSRYARYSEESGIPLYPIIGSASLPFRGGLTPYSIEAFTNEFKGIRTALLQSAFRYDYPKDDVVKAVKQLQQILPKGKPGPNTNV
jgi:phosphoenolpyruvate carboxylase